MLQPQVDINLKNLKENYNYIQNKLGNASIMAVVKANGYGHGILEIATALSESGVYGFCVALTSEARELILGGIDNPILHLGRIYEEDLDIYKSRQVRCTINNLEDIKILESYGKENNIIFYSHLKIDTGLGRMGIFYNDADSILKTILNCKYIQLEGIYSHFSTAEEKSSEFRDYQLDRFKKIIVLTQSFTPLIKYFHIANSAAVLTCRDAYFNMARPGLSLYGITPLGYSHEKLKPVMKMLAPIAISKLFNKGDSIGYNRKYILDKNEKIIVLQAGYADGIPTEFGNNGFVEIDGKSYEIVGKVSMDLTAIKFPPDKKILTEKAIFWGSNNKAFRLESISKKYEKNPYEFLTGITARVKRNYIYE